MLLLTAIWGVLAIGAVAASVTIAAACEPESAWYRSGALLFATFSVLACVLVFRHVEDSTTTGLAWSAVALLIASALCNMLGVSRREVPPGMGVRRMLAHVEQVVLEARTPR